MNRKTLSSGCLFLFLLLMASTSCNNSGRSMFRADNNVEFDTIVVNERHYLHGDTANPYCDINIQFVYPESNNRAGVDSLQRVFVRNMFGLAYDTLAPNVAVQKYVQNYVENYNQDAETYRETVTDLVRLNEMIPEIDLSDSEHATEDIFYSYYETISDSIVFNSYGVVSFQVKQSNNKGGATSYNSYRNYVINLNTGAQLTENDIFNAGYDTALQGLIIASLLEQNQLKTVEDLEDMGFFGIQEIVPNKNFLLNNKGITYTYNKGEYSAYQLDAPEVFIPYNSIRSLLRENTIVSKLADL